MCRICTVILATARLLRQEHHQLCVAITVQNSYLVDAKFDKHAKMFMTKNQVNVKLVALGAEPLSSLCGRLLLQLF